MTLILGPIEVDDREPSAEKRVEQFERIGIPARVTHLPNNGGGDYRWLVEPQRDGQTVFVVIVERKTVNDLLSSVTDGRLSEFVNQEPTDRAFRVLLVEGDTTTLSTFGTREWTGDTIDNLLADVQCHGVCVVRSKHESRTVERIRSLYVWTGRDEHSTFTRPNLPTTEQRYLIPEERDRVRNLMTIPGWGEVVSRAVQREFPVLGDVYQALLSGDTKALQAVKGMGSGRVKQARAFLGLD